MTWREYVIGLRLACPDLWVSCHMEQPKMVLNIIGFNFKMNLLLYIYSIYSIHISNSLSFLYSQSQLPASPDGVGCCANLNLDWVQIQHRVFATYVQFGEPDIALATWTRTMAWIISQIKISRQKFYLSSQMFQVTSHVLASQCSRVLSSQENIMLNLKNCPTCRHWVRQT